MMIYATRQQLHNGELVIQTIAARQQMDPTIVTSTPNIDTCYCSLLPNHRYIAFLFSYNKPSNHLAMGNKNRD